MKAANDPFARHDCRHDISITQHETEMAFHASDMIAEHIDRDYWSVAILPGFCLDLVEIYLRRLFPRFGTASFGTIPYTPIDSDKLLAEFMRSSWPDEVEFARSVGGIAKRMLRYAHHNKVVIASGIGQSLIGTGNMEAAIRIEELWIELLRHYPIRLHCLYSKGRIDGLEQEETLQKIFDLHAKSHADATHQRKNELKSA